MQNFSPIFHLADFGEFCFTIPSAARYEILKAKFASVKRPIVECMFKGTHQNIFLEKTIKII